MDQKSIWRQIRVGAKEMSENSQMLTSTPVKRFGVMCRQRSIR